MAFGAVRPLIATVVLWLATVVTGASVAVCESGTRYDDGAVVLMTVSNWSKRLREPAMVTMTRPNAFADFCERTHLMTWRHLWMGVQAATWGVSAPEWAAGSHFFCGPTDVARANGCHARRTGHVGTVLHSFYSRSRGRGWVAPTTPSAPDATQTATD